MTGCVTRLVIPPVLLGLFSYVVLPGLVEDQISRRLQESVGVPTEPEVEVSSSFPPEMLLGRIDRVRVRSDRMSLQGVAFYECPREPGGRQRLVAEPVGGELQGRGPELLPGRLGATGADRREPGVPRLPGPGAGLILWAAAHPRKVRPLSEAGHANIWYMAKKN